MLTLVFSCVLLLLLAARFRVEMLPVISATREKDLTVVDEKLNK